MAKFRNNKGAVELYEIEPAEMVHFMKLNIKASIVFIKDGNINDMVELLDRDYKGNVNTIIIKHGDKKVRVDYGKIFDIISKNQESGFRTSIIIPKKEFSTKQPLLLMLGKYKKSIIESCVCIDYNIVDRYFTIRYKPGRFSNVLYYFESNDSALLFNNNGPSLIYDDSINSIEDILCD
jgi:hypothetical protein